MLLAAAYATVVYFITEQPPEPDRYFKVIGVYILVTISADGLGILLGTLVNPIVRKSKIFKKIFENIEIFLKNLRNLKNLQAIKFFSFLERNILCCRHVLLHDRVFRLPGAVQTHAGLYASRQRHQSDEVLS